MCIHPCQTLLERLALQLIHRPAANVMYHHNTGKWVRIPRFLLFLSTIWIHPAHAWIRWIAGYDLATNSCKMLSLPGPNISKRWLVISLHMGGGHTRGGHNVDHNSASRSSECAMHISSSSLSSHGSHMVAASCPKGVLMPVQRLWTPDGHQNVQLYSVRNCQCPDSHLCT